MKTTTHLARATAQTVAEAPSRGPEQVWVPVAHHLRPTESGKLLAWLLRPDVTSRQKERSRRELMKALRGPMPRTNL